MSSQNNLNDNYTTAPGRLIDAYKKYVAAPVYNSPQARHLGKTIYEIKNDPFSPAILTTYRSIAKYLSIIHPTRHVNLKNLVDQFLSYKGGEK